MRVVTHGYDSQNYVNEFIELFTMVHLGFAASSFASMHQFSIVNFNSPTLILVVIDTIPSCP